jgi:hypothetical protein
MNKNAMIKKLCYLASVALTAAVVQNASAQSWIDTDLNGLWSDANNWSGGKPTSVAGGIAIIDPAPGPSCTIVASEVESVGTLSDHSSSWGSIYGPEWGAVLNIYGTLNFDWVLAPVQNNFLANRSVINMYNGSYVGGVNLGLGTEWWYNAAPYVTMNMFGNAQANVTNFWPGGHLNIYDTATLNVSGGIIVQTVAAVDDGTRFMNLAGGQIILPTGQAANAVTWIQRGILLAYGRSQNIADLVSTVYTGDNGTTNIVTVDNITITDDSTNTVITTTPLGGALTAISFQPLVHPQLSPGTVQQAMLVGAYPAVSGVLLSSADPGVNPTNLTGLAFSSSNTNVCTVSTSGLVTAAGLGSATLHAALGSFSATLPISVTPATVSLVHQYSFSESSGTTTADSIGGTDWAGTLTGTASLSGGKLVLDGTQGSYVQLPAGVVANMESLTIETWASFGALQTWAVLYGFGNISTTNGQNYITFQPHTGGATAQATFGIGNPGSAAERDAAQATALDGMANLQIACVYNPPAGTLSYYTNGVFAATVTLYNSLTVPVAYQTYYANSSDLAATLGADPINYIGGSLYAADPGLNASIDEFRIYSGPMQAAQIGADYLLGPNQLLGTTTSVTLSATLSGGNLVLTWPTNSALVNLVSSPVLGTGATWSPVSLTPGGNWIINGSNYQVTLTPSASAQYYRLHN